jgi:4,4'-diaponeurosporenoate glycosyltransferase
MAGEVIWELVAMGGVSLVWLCVVRPLFSRHFSFPSIPLEGISVIVPARNESGNLPRLLKSLSGKEREVIVVDDGSTDGTGRVARELGATVIESEELPDGWKGKTWACWQGAKIARGEWFLFLDADVWFEERGLLNLVLHYENGAFSMSPYHAVEKSYEQLSAFFNLVMNLGTLKNGLFGQCLLIDRASYERVGGHAAVKGFVLENFRLAAHCRAAGIPTRSVVGKGILNFRMYPDGVAELVRGWIKGFGSGAGHTPFWKLAGVVLLLTIMTAAIGILATHLSWGMPIYLLLAVLVGAALQRVGRFWWLTAIFYPMGLLFFYGVFAVSVMRSGREVTWKGRVVRAD